ncbi:MAG: hypothetical protein Q8S84_05120 [bacterium]|nr:hypothetical protein [bacterium]
MFFSMNSSTSFVNSSDISSFDDKVFTSSSSWNDSIILINFNALSNSVTSTSLSATKSNLASIISIHFPSKYFSTSLKSSIAVMIFIYDSSEIISSAFVS